MNRVTGRPLFMFCSLFFIISLLLPYAPAGAKLILMIFSAVVAVLSFILPLGRRMSPIAKRCVHLACAAIVLSCVWSVCVINIPINRASKFDGKTVDAEISIVDTQYSSSYYGYYTAKIKLSSTDHSEKVYLGMPDGSASVGDIFTGTLTLSVPSEEECPTLYADGIYLKAEAEGVTYIRHDDHFSLTKVFSDINARLSAKLRSAAEGHGNLAAAVLLGDRNHLETSLKRDFSRLGIYHLLAVSGIHLSVIVGIVSYFLRKAKTHRALKGIINVLCILSFMALTGFSASIMRAGIMHLIATAAGIFDKESDSLTSLSLAAALIIIVSPAAVYDVGLILSVLAAFACISYSILSRERRRSSMRPTRLRKAFTNIADTVLLTMFINAMTLPVMWCVFGELSLISPLTNIIFIPLVTALLFFSVLFIPLSGFPYLSAVAGFAVSLLEDVITETASVVSPLPHITVSMRFEGVGVFAILLFLSLLPIALVSRKARKVFGITSAVSIAGLVVCIAVGIILADMSCSVYYTVRGKSEGFVLRDGNDFTLVDMSDGSSGIQYDMLTVAEEAGAVEIRSLMLTHYHRKHLSSIPTLADRTVVRSVLLPNPVNDTDIEVYEKLIDAMNERKIEIITYARESDGKYVSGSLDFDFHEYTTLSRSTHPIVSFAFRLGGKNYVYAGGSAAQGDEDITAEIASADTVFFGAHPPVTKDVSGVSPKGTVVISEKAASDMLTECTSDAHNVTVAADRSTYHTETYKKQ